MLGLINQTIIGFAFAKLREEGKVNFETSLDTFFPEYSKAKEVKIWQMLHMTSGIPDYAELSGEHFLQTHPDLPEDEADFLMNQGDGSDVTLDKVFAMINDQPLLFTPGEKFAYSNTNYRLLGEIIQQLTGEPYSVYLKKNIFDPLEMSDTFCSTLYAEAQSYREVAGNPRVYRLSEHLAADGSMVTTLEDMIKWAQAILQRKLLKPESWDLIFELYLGTYGLGWFDLVGWYYHGGQIFGYISEIFVRREEKRAIIMLYNKDFTEELGRLNWSRRSDWMKRWLAEP